MRTLLHTEEFACWSRFTATPALPGEQLSAFERSGLARDERDPAQRVSGRVVGRHRHVVYLQASGTQQRLRLLGCVVGEEAPRVRQTFGATVWIRLKRRSFLVLAAQLEQDDE